METPAGAMQDFRVALLALESLRERAESVTIAELCERCQGSRATIHRTLRMLDDKGMIVRRRREFGGPTLVGLTDKGRELAEHARVIVNVLGLAKNGQIDRSRMAKSHPGPEDVGIYTESA